MVEGVCLRPRSGSREALIVGGNELAPHSLLGSEELPRELLENPSLALRVCQGVEEIVKRNS